MALVKLGDRTEGSIVKLRENGVLVDFYVAKHNYESGLNGAGRTLVVRKDCCDPRRWGDGKVNDYASSDIDEWMNGDYKNLLDADIRTAMKTTKFYYSPGNISTAKTTLSRSVFALSVTELDRTSTSDILNVEGTPLPIASTLQIAYLNGSAVNQWTRSPRIDKTTSVWYLKTNGTCYSNSSITATFCPRPAFALPASCYVSDDGSVSVNTAPTTPKSLSVPAQINGGSTVTISWGAASDAEGNLEGYVLERSTDGGSSWSQVYQGSGTSTTNTVPFGTESVMYRVKAYDSEGLNSSWRNSGQVTVINNHAPSAPATITVPTIVLGGAELTVTWSAASDSDGDLAGYSLERQVDGEWSEVYRGPELTYTDTITRGWPTVAYRVRAFDSHAAYSGYATSPARAVNNNVAPVITCERDNGSDLGTKTEGFAVAYSAGDADGDPVTVTESIDGQLLRTFTAEEGESCTFDVTGETFMKLLNGTHTLTITANDGQVSAVHSLTFTKEVTRAAVTLEHPMEADGAISMCVLAVSGHIPADAVYKVEVTNNARDDAPAWEDCTDAVRTGANHIFANQSAAKGFAFSFRLTVERGPSGQGGYITSVQGGFQ